MLAQLLLKFQKPIIEENNAMQNVTNITNQFANDTFNNNYVFNNSMFPLERSKRSIPSIADNEVPHDPENMIKKENLIKTPDFTTDGKLVHTM